MNKQTHCWVVRCQNLEPLVPARSGMVSTYLRPAQTVLPPRWETSTERSPSASAWLAAKRSVGVAGDHHAGGIIQVVARPCNQVTRRSRSAGRSWMCPGQLPKVCTTLTEGRRDPERRSWSVRRPGVGRCPASPQQHRCASGYGGVACTGAGYRSARCGGRVNGQARAAR